VAFIGLGYYAWILTQSWCPWPGRFNRMGALSDDDLLGVR
jgi:hypothetical protein